MEEKELVLEDFNELFSDILVDPKSITLEEADIQDETVHVERENLSSYKLDHLKKWLLFRGDSLHGIESLKDAQIRVLKYFELKTQNNIVDPTENMLWIRTKAEKLNLILKPQTFSNVSPLPCPDILKAEIANTKNAIGWSKSLDNIPSISIEHIEEYHNEMNNRVMDKVVKIKKPFVRGNKFLVEQYLDESSVYVKQDNEYFIIKGVCAASLKKADRWIFIAIKKNDSKIIFAFCQSPAGKLGTCSHAYALMKMIATWSLDKLKVVPEPKACTSKQCAWSVPQSKERVEKIPLAEINFTSPTRNVEKRKAHKSNLFDARTTTDDHNDKELIKYLISDETNHASNIINEHPTKFVKTMYGNVPAGSCLSYQCSLMPHDFQVYSSVEHKASGNIYSNQQFPPTLNSTQSMIHRVFGNKSFKDSGISS